MGQGGRIDVYVDPRSTAISPSSPSAATPPSTPPTPSTSSSTPSCSAPSTRPPATSPPFNLPAKARYGAHDVRRACRRAGVPDTRPPPDFAARAHSVLPLRALHHIRRHWAPDVYVAAFHYLFYRFWTPVPDHADLRQPDVLRAVLAAAPAGFDGSSSSTENTTTTSPLFTPSEVDAIVAAANEQPAKDLLTAATQEAVARGAFGSPWLWVQNSAGEQEPFFGSDRFPFVYQFLGLPYQEVALLEAPQRAQTKNGPKL